MPISEKTKYGTITITDHIYASIVEDVLEEENFSGIVWVSTKRGKVVTDALQSMKIGQAENEIVISLYIVVKFGISIKKICKEFADRLADKVVDACGNSELRILINVAGIKSKNIARRDVEVVFKYEAK